MDLRQYDLLFNMLPDAILVTDMDGVIVYANALAEKLFLYERNELLGQSIEVLAPEALRGQHTKQRQNYLKHPYIRPMGAKSNIQAQKKDATVFPADINLSPFPIESESLVISVIRDLTDHYQAQAALRESEERFRALIENSEEGILVLDGNSNIKYVSPSYSKILGYDTSELIGRSAFEPIHPAFMEAAEKAFAKLLIEPGKSENIELQLLHVDGSPRWVDATGSNLLHLPGIQGIVVNFRDISQHKQAEKQILQSGKRAETLVRISERLNSKIDLDELLQTICVETASATNARAACIYLLDLRTNRIHLRSSFGLTEQEKNIFPSFPLESFEELAERLGSVGIIDNPANIPGSENMDTFENFSVVYAGINREKSFIGILVAITKRDEQKTDSDLLLKGLAEQASIAIVNARIFYERKRMTEDLERRLSESQVLGNLSRALNETLNLDKIFHMIVDAMLVLLPKADSAVIHLLDQENQILQMEARAGRISSSLGHEFNLPLDRGLAGWVFKKRTKIKVGNVLEEPLYLPRADSQVRSIIVVPVQNKERFFGTLSVNSHELYAFSSRDEELIETLAQNASIAIANAGLYQELGEKYRELQRIQTRLVQSEKLVSVGQLLSGIAHELNNPLTSILLSSQMLLQRVPSDLAADVVQLEKESLRTVNLVRGLLDFSRQRSTRRVPLNIIDILNESLKLTKSQMDFSNVALETHYSENLPSIKGDPYQLQQVFINLINNACQAMAEQTRSRVLKLSIEKGRSRLETVKQEIFVRIIFRDTGPGIPPEILPFLFEPFFTTKTEGKGTGLGLPIAHGIVTQHKGHIWAESLPGEGTRFYVEIPTAKEKNIPVSFFHAAPRPLTGSLRMGTILIIDDEVALTAILKKALERKGYKVDVAHHAKSALEKIGDISPSLILCDMHLQGITGMELYSKFREVIPDVPVVFITGDSLDNNIRTFLEKTQAPYLIKPFELADLTEKIGEILPRKMNDEDFQ